MTSPLCGEAHALVHRTLNEPRFLLRNTTYGTTFTVYCKEEFKVLGCRRVAFDTLSPRFCGLPCVPVRVRPTFGDRLTHRL